MSSDRADPSVDRHVRGGDRRSVRAHSGRHPPQVAGPAGRAAPQQPFQRCRLLLPRHSASSL